MAPESIKGFYLLHVLGVRLCLQSCELRSYVPDVNLPFL